MGSIRALGALRRAHVHDGDRGRSCLCAQADELPGARADLQTRHHQLPRAANASGRIRYRASLRAVRRTAWHVARTRVHAGRCARVLHDAAGDRGVHCDQRADHGHLPRLRLRRHPRQVRGPAGSARRRGRRLGPGRAGAAGRTRAVGDGLHDQPRRRRLLWTEARIRAAGRDRPRLAVRDATDRPEPAQPARRELHRRGRRASCAGHDPPRHVWFT